MMVFAWNEFEEGGWLCPTIGRDGTFDTTRIEEFRKALALLDRPDLVANYFPGWRAVFAGATNLFSDGAGHLRPDMKPRRG